MTLHRSIHTLRHTALTLLTAAAGLCATSSCQEWFWENGNCLDDSPIAPSAAVGTPFTVDIEIHTPSGRLEAPSRSAAQLDEDTENLISEVAVLLFTVDADGNPDRLGQVLTPYVLQRDDNNRALYHALCASTINKAIADQRIRVCILANASHLTDQLMASSTEPYLLSYAEVEELMQTVLTDSPAELETCLEPRLADPEKPFVMWGLPHDILSVEPDATLTVEACLLRDLARFDVRLTDELKQSGVFDFRTVHFYKPSSTVCHMPLRDKVSETVDETGHPYYWATSPTLRPDNQVYYRWDYEEGCVRDGEFTCQCYVPEGNVVLKGLNGGAGKPKDINHTNRPAVIVGGYFNGAAEMSYYRLDVMDGAGNLMDIMRNHLYDMVIRAVLGPGQPTPDEAYDSNSVLIVAQVTDWCMVERDVMFNGPDWITVNKRVINLTGSAGAGTTFIINSSVPLDQWEFKLGEEGDFTTDPLLESETFFVTRPIQETGSKMLVVTKHELPAGELPVTERLYVRIGGRVLFYITLVQHPLQGDYWFLGDFFPGEKGPWQPVIIFPIGGVDPSIPPGSFIDFLRWLFGADINGSIGEGDNISPTEYINNFFWSFLSWFFTDEYGHVIGGTPDDWNEDWRHPMAIIVFDFFKWMLGPDYYRQIEGPSTDPYDPDNPKYSTVGPQMAFNFLKWSKFFDFMREIAGPSTDPYDPENPKYTTVGAEMLTQFIAWMKAQDFWADLGFQQGENGGNKEDVTHSVDVMLKFFDWYLDIGILGELGIDRDPQGPGGPGTDPSGKPIEIPGHGLDPWWKDDPIHGDVGGDPDRNY